MKILQDSIEVSDYIGNAASAIIIQKYNLVPYSAAGHQLFKTIQFCGFINLKRDMLYFTRCIFTVRNNK